MSWFRVIKEDDLFLVTDNQGDVAHPQRNDFAYGLFTKDTRVLSRFYWVVDGVSFHLLSADASRNYEGIYRYGNDESALETGTALNGDTLILSRRQLIDGHGGLVEETVCENFGEQDVELRLNCMVDVDFSDMFEVRGYLPTPLSKTIRVMTANQMAVFSYTASDGQLMKTMIRLETGARESGYVSDSGEGSAVSEGSSDGSPDGSSVTSGVRLRAKLQVGARQSATWRISVMVRAESAGAGPDAAAFAGMAGMAALAGMAGMADVEQETASSGKAGPGVEPSAIARREADPFEVAESVPFAVLERELQGRYSDWNATAPQVQTLVDFERWYGQGLRDLRMLVTDVGYGPFPVAGVPWFAVPFGRDSLLTAFEALHVQPQLVRGTLATLAAFQGQQLNVARDEEPGKMMHELRVGELSRTGKMPFGPYYGSIDATPLFLVLAAEYADWTGDLPFVRGILGHVKRAFEWIENYGDRDGDGFVEYDRQADGGIANQGWKDSGDSIMHKDGRLAVGPIALCEVQGYVYKAYQSWTRLYRRLERTAEAEHCQQKAQRLQKQFIETFWIDADAVVALALDVHKTPLRVATSNMGQVLWSGILPDILAGKLVARLMQPDLFSGFGVRTLSALEAAYHPLSYHNGSVWPHDNAFILFGMSQYGYTDAAVRVAEGLLRAAGHFPQMRLPELFGGYAGEPDEAPAPYRVSCSPQAWAAAAPLLTLRALLGVKVYPDQSAFTCDPRLLPGMDHLIVTGLALGAGTVDIAVERAISGGLSVSVINNATGWKFAESGELTLLRG
ncbi:MAG: amylo-alpha-1,6-glucosidase [Bacilli bacterium]